MAAIIPRQKPVPRKLPSKRVSAIPRRVLNALGLRQPVVGVFRHKNRPHYGVAYRDEEGRRCSRAFSFADSGDETVAYAQAVKFRQKTLRGKVSK